MPPNKFPSKKVAVLGTGSAGSQHLAALQKIEGVAPIPISARREGLQGLEKSGADLCVIATDTGRHLSDSLFALDLGMDLLVEKPLAVDAQSALQILRKAERKNRRVQVGCVLRFSESLMVFREWLPQIGPIHQVRLECLSYLPDWRPFRDYHQTYSARANEGGVLRDLIHDIDLAGWIFGWPKKITARLKNREILQIEAEEQAELWWEGSAGENISIALDYLNRIPRRKMVVCGQNGILQWDGVKTRTVLRLIHQTPKVFSSRQTKEEMFLKQARAFVNGGGGATVQEGIQALALCDAARLSGKNRREEPVPSF